MAPWAAQSRQVEASWGAVSPEVLPPDRAPVAAVTTVGSAVAGEPPRSPPPPLLPLPPDRGACVLAGAAVTGAPGDCGNARRRVVRRDLRRSLPDAEPVAGRGATDRECGWRHDRRRHRRQRRCGTGRDSMPQLSAGTAASPDTGRAGTVRLMHSGPAGSRAAIAPVRPITADAARPLAAMRLPAAACLRRGADRRAWSAAILSACSASVVIDAPFGRGCGSCRCCYRQQISHALTCVCTFASGFVRRFALRSSFYVDVRLSPGLPHCGLVRRGCVAARRPAAGHLGGDPAEQARATRSCSPTRAASIRSVTVGRRARSATTCSPCCSSCSTSRRCSSSRGPPSSSATAGFGLVEMGIFVFVLLLGLVYAWRKGVLRWV